MKSLMKQCAAATLAVSTGIAPMATQLSGAVAARTGVAAATSAVVLLAPSAAQAQSGKRICATVWGVQAVRANGLAAMGMELSKSDFVTCPSLLATMYWIKFPAGLMRTAKTVFNKDVEWNGARQNHSNQTCEAFSRTMEADTADVCLRMTDYKLYRLVKVYGGVFSVVQGGL